MEAIKFSTGFWGGNLQKTAQSANPRKNLGNVSEDQLAKRFVSKLGFMCHLRHEGRQRLKRYFFHPYRNMSY